MPRSKTHAKIDGTMHKVASIIDHPNGDPTHARVHLGCGMTVDTHDEDLGKDPHKRWHKKDRKAATCPNCAAVEDGAAPVNLPLGFNRPTTVMADEPTGVPCPQCGAEIRRRNKDGQFACVAQGHEFDGADLMQQIAANMQRLVGMTKKS